MQVYLRFDVYTTIRMRLRTVEWPSGVAGAIRFLASTRSKVVKVNSATGTWVTVSEDRLPENSTCLIRCGLIPFQSERERNIW